MFGYFKRKKEQRERKEQLRGLGDAVADHLRAEMDLYIEMSVAPRRAAFVEVFRGELETLDERLAEADAGPELGRLEAAGIDYQIMLENWSATEDADLEAAERALAEQFQIADTIGVADEYRAALRDELGKQKLALMSDGLEVIAELVPEARAASNET